ncbi:hypothetical protein M153_9650003, partial [Pseudoloma neurophilia]
EAGLRVASYLERYLQSNTLPTKSGIMISLSKWDTKQKERQTDTYPARVTKAKYKMDNLDITFEIQLVHLEDIRQQKVFNWVTDFENHANSAKWDESQKLIILQNIISASILSQLAKSDSTQNILLGLKKLSIDNYSLPALSTSFKDCTQNMFSFVREYFTELEELSTKIAISLGYTQKETQILLSTTFFANLGSHTAIYLQKQRVESYEPAKLELLRLEEILINEAKKV